MAGVKRNINEMYSNNNGTNNNSSIGQINNSSNGNMNNPNSLSSVLNGSNNGNMNDDQHNGSSVNEAKKTRLDNNNHTKQDASRVVHLRNIPQQLSENEIIYLGLTFGNIINVLFLRSKNQAFLEFETLPDAQQMIAHFNTSSVQFHGKKIFVQYSNHQELNTDPTNTNNQHAQTALSEAVQLHTASKIGGKNTVLRAAILNMVYPVTLDVLHQIFSKYGAVLKIITFNKNDKFQVLIQLKDSQATQAAKMNLNNQNIYNGCCTLQIDFSKLTTLEVRFNNDKSRDYTNLLLPTGQDGVQSNGLNSNNNNNGNNDHMMNNNHSNNNSSHQLSALQYQQQSLIGNPPNIFAAVQAAAAQLPFSHQHNSNNSNMNHPFNQGNQNNNNSMNMLNQHQSHHLGNSLNNNNTNGNNNNQSMGGVQSPVLLVSNLNEDFVTPDALFTLFGVYGDVLRVKILFNKKDSALINFSNSQHAATALTNLDRCKLWNKQIRVFPSKHVTVQMPKDGQPDSGLTKDFTNSPLHRFKKPGSKNFNNIFPPSQTLHLSNIPNTIEENELKDLFAMYGQVRGFKFFQKEGNHSSDSYTQLSASRQHAFEMHFQ